MARSMERRWEAGADAVLADMGCAEVFGNVALLLQPAERRVVDRALRFFGPASPFMLMSPWPTDDLAGLGLQLVGHPPFMLRPAGVQPAPAERSGLRITEVSDAAGVAAFERTLIEAFPSPALAAAPPGVLFDSRVLGGPLHLWLGWERDRPVCTAAASVHAGVAHIEFVSTRPECRGRGYGAAITRRASTADPRLPAVLLSSDLGRPVYERLGYLPLNRWTLWCRE